jgi:phosphopantetheine adenylyltransferase
MKILKLILLFTVSIFSVIGLSAQQDTITNVKSFKCSSKLVRVCPDTIIGLTQYIRDTTLLHEQIRNLKKQPVKKQDIPAPVEKFNPETDKFLNVEDEAIFTSRFKNYLLEEIHPRSRDYYLMIKSIHDLSDYLMNTEKILSNSNIEKVVKDMNLPRETVTLLLQESAKKELKKAEQKLDDIIPFAKYVDSLSAQQKQYYRMLKDKFNELYKQIYPNQ